MSRGLLFSEGAVRWVDLFPSAEHVSVEARSLLLLRPLVCNRHAVIPARLLVHPARRHKTEAQSLKVY